MSVSGISSGVSVTPPSFQALKTQVSQDFSTIASSLQSGDISGARQAYSDIVQLTHGTAAASTTDTTTASSATGSSGGSGFFGSLVKLGLSLLK